VQRYIKFGYLLIWLFVDLLIWFNLKLSTLNPLFHTLGILENFMYLYVPIH